MYTIFKNETLIILTDQLNISDKGFRFNWEELTTKEALLSLISEGLDKIVFYHSDLKFMWQEFRNKFKIIEASGGIVKNQKHEILFIFRNDKWDLPKGKIESGESRAEAASREVEEECGFTRLKTGEFVGTTYHLYSEKNEEILKVSFWYEMFSDQSDLTPQLEEGITELKWVKEQDFSSVLDNTYPNISLLMDMYVASNQ
ncbi:NUDIX domain-containing protein [Lutimonas saemankumensis]|uniref:NUDIX hydrolase n=1 Tax=Lutimonas saemankumensis TaxID=483016 RepID=UPI001CD3C12A|nr:NUDIX domain-containing protein [Lutimonas saemankumensis]MCA0932252.1 NUDIX domain-containing protein [Lutimonas saemankumensis]